MKYNFKILLIIFILLSYILLINCTNQEGNSLTPVAEKGILDLSNWDFPRQGIIPLHGEWEFYWQRLLKPADFMYQNGIDAKSYIALPQFWNHTTIDNNKLSPFGFATYRLTILHNFSQELMGISIPRIQSAYWLFADGILLLKNGEVAEVEQEYSANIIPQKIFFKPVANKTIIIIQTANYHEQNGGVYDISLGTEKQISQKYSSNIALDFLLFGSIFIIGLYHLAFFILRTREKGALFFGIFCLIISIRTLLMGERFFHIFFSWFGYSWLVRLEYLSIPLAAIFFSLYFKSFDYVKWFKYFHYPILVLSLLEILFMMFAPIHIFQDLLFIYHLIIILAACVILVVLFQGILRKNKSVLLFLVGFFFIFVTVVNDVLFTQKIINTGFLFSYGLLVFIFIQSFLLSREFNRAYKSVEKLSKELIAVDKLKDDFLAKTSYELKAPLHTIIGLSEAIIDGSAGKINQVQAKNLAQIIARGRQLSNLVSDIVDFSKIKENKLLLKKQVIDIREICENVFLFARPLLTNKKILLKNQIDEEFPYIAGDGKRILQVFNNLIVNAIENTEKGEIIVSAEEQRKFARISVKDTGKGIPEKKLLNIFESFAQVNPNDPYMESGKGLGLSIVKSLIELHGGEIEVESVMGKGSIFTFTLPLSKEQGRKDEEEPDQTGLIEIPEAKFITTDKTPEKKKEVSRKFNLLIIDDQQVYQKQFKNLLAQDKFIISSALNAQEAIRLLNKNIYDIIFLDLTLPDVSAYNLCVKIRKKYSQGELPIILLTSKNMVGDLSMGLKAKANDFLAKPLIKAELIARLRAHLELAKIKKAYSRFIPLELIKLLGKDSIIEVERGDQIYTEMTILFCDIRAFMALSEKMTPKENFNFLNSFFEKIAPTIRKYNGFIDKYIGDEIMALFPKNPENALQAAIDIKKAIDTYNIYRTKIGFDPISVGIGLHTGPTMLGTIGDKKAMQGTVISDTVNIAARLEGLTKLYGGSIIISADIFFNLKDPSKYFYRFLGLVQVKGKREYVQVYEIFDDSDEGQHKQKTKDDFEKALQLYFNKEFEEAEVLFSEILIRDPDDRTARLYMNRAKEFKQSGVPEDWDGVEKVQYK